MSKVTAQQVAAALGRGKETRGEDGVWRTFCPAHEDTKSPSLAVSENAKGKLLVHCHAGCSQGAVIDRLKGLDLWPTREDYETWAPSPVPPGTSLPNPPMSHPEHGKPTHTWNYTSSTGAPIGAVYRFTTPSGKILLPVNWCSSSKGRQSWRFKGFSNPRPLYRLSELAERPSAPVLIVEGEKSCEAAQSLFPDYVAMTWQGGSKSTRYADVAPLAGRTIVLWPDADEPGYKAMEELAELLHPIAKKVLQVELPDGLPKGWDLADEIPGEIDLLSVLQSAQEISPVSEGVIEELNKTYALVLLGDKAVIVEEQTLPSGRLVPRYLNITAFHQYFSNRLIPQGRREVPVSKVWMEDPGRRTYNGVIFYPGHVTPQYYNLWRGFSVEPDPTGDCSMFLEHVLENVAQGSESLYNWIMGWFAQMVQRPTEKPGTSLAIRGKQGTGKTFVGEHIGALFRQHYVLVDNPKHVYGSFNQHFINCLLLHADEGFWAGDPRHIGMLKGLVTSKTQRIEPKGKDTFEVDSFIRLLVTSNDSFIVPAAFEERRFAVLDMGVRRQQDIDYFIAAKAQLLNGGYGRLLHELQQWDLTTVDIHRIPATFALAEQKQYSMNGVLQFWFELLQQGYIGHSLGWPDHVTKDELYDLYIESAQQRGDRYRVSKIDFGRKLQEAHPAGKFHDVRVQTRIFDRKTSVSLERRVWALALPKLPELRAHFDAIIGMAVPWQTVEIAETDTASVPF